MTNILLLENPHRKADQVFGKNKYTIRRISESLDEGDLIDIIADKNVVGIRSKTNVSANIISKAKNLWAIGAFCIGTNQIDLDSATQKGIAVFNAPYSNTRSVVELAICEIIALTRRLTVQNSKLHRGIWNKSSDQSHEVRGRTLGIIGYGNIGTQLSVLAEALGMKVIFYDIEERLALGNAKSMSSMDEVLKKADIVSIHVDGKKSNTNLFGSKQFELMKEGALFINLSRGFIVDIEALRQNLLNGHLKGAAIDVFPSEPSHNGEGFISGLAKLDNVILTPHVGGSTIEAQEDIALFVANKICDYLHYGTTTLSVNLPNLSLEPASNSAYRLCFLHHNTPGVLARFNKFLAKNHLNVEGQGLATEGELGYAITDLAQQIDEETFAQINNLDETILLRQIELASK